MLEAALADVAQQRLEFPDAHHPGAAEGLQRIVGEFAFPDVAMNRALAIVGRKTREAHRPGFHAAHARPVSVLSADRPGDDLLIVHADFLEKMLRKIAAMEADR